ncbi:hypothetical protein Lser_V15G14301 [Lactuca serriola]
MGGKGKKRREKNYKEAHGVGKNRLPPPPVRSSLDVIPSKLRQLMSYTSGSGKLTVDVEEHKKGGNSRGGSGGGNLIENKVGANEKPDFVVSDSKIKDNDEGTEKKKKKRKRKQVDDLRFEAELGAVGSKRKERKKKLLEERKKKKKKTNEGEINFPGREEIKFGDVVKAPPKLVNVPKKFGSSNASQERIRLRAIEAYRDQKKWASRPGVHQPTIDITQPSL